ncbi:MAG: hypothetical protein AB1457_06270 [Chloroflexota bacterium]|nr:MAG: hypothetical protein KatS3mg045_0969 [Bellilinea sp.]
MKQFFALLTALLFGLNLFQGTPAIASGRLDPRKNDQKVCTGTWKFPPLYVGGKDGVVFAEAAYEFDENCNPVLVSETRLTSVPTWVTNPSQQPVDEKTVEAVEVPASDQPNTQNNDLGVGDSILTVDTCHLRTFEEDVIFRHDRYSDRSNLLLGQCKGYSLWRFYHSNHLLSLVVQKQWPSRNQRLHEFSSCLGERGCQFLLSGRAILWRPAILQHYPL